MTSKHHNWHQRWTVDLPAATATHETGLFVRFFPVKNGRADYYHDDKTDVVLGVSMSKDGSKWIAVTTVQSRDHVFDQLVGENGPHNTPRMITRLGNEAGQMWAHAWYVAMKKGLI